jgi:hypothetical protein
LALAGVLWLCYAPVLQWVAGWQGPRDLAALLILTCLGGLVYGLIILALFGRSWLKTFRARRRG